MFKHYRYHRFFLLIIVVAFHCFSAYAQQPAVKTANELVPPFNSTFGYGSNTRGQSNGWTDQTVAGIINKAGGTTLRATLPDNFIQTWGINVRLSAFQTYTNTLGMKDLVCFVEGPSAAHQDKTVYPGNTSSSKLFANLYTSIWNSDGSVNQTNYYAYYIYQLVQTYGPYIRFWEVVNEPDLTYNADVSQWLTRAPLPSETPNTQAPFYNYVRMLRITWEVVKKYNPNSFVTTGGIGYDTYLDALLRYTDNPTDGSVTSQYPNKGGAYFDVLSYHVYPSWFLRYWDNNLGNFRYTQNSDYAAAQVIKTRNAMDAVLQKYGYNGSTYPKKYFIATETNVGRRTSDWRYGSDEMQRNFDIKTMVLAQKNDIKQIHLYGVSESINAPAAGTTVNTSDENRLMGLYENLDRDAPGSEKLTQEGVGNRTIGKLLKGYTYDAGATVSMNFPTTVEGGAFVSNGSYIYVIWAKNPNDKTENYSTSYSFPGSFNNISTFDRFEWDYSTTGTSSKQSPQGITLNTSPSFFKVSATSGNAAPATTGSSLYRINAGGPTVTNSIGTFAADAYSSSGNTFSTTSAIAGTSNAAMYQTERFGTNGTFSYAFPVANGSYTVVLHFAELYWTSAGKRVFDVSIEGNKVLDNYDIFSKAGALTATSQTFAVNVTDGTLNIYFSSLATDGGADQPKVSAIEIINAGAITTSTAPATTTSQVLSSFTLINASNNQDIQTVNNGATLNLATLPSRSLNIRANTSPATVGSVVFNLSGAQSKTVTETSAPYALFGDNAGVFNAWTPSVGSYTLKATPYTAAGGSGTAGTPLSISFIVINQSTATARMAASQLNGKSITTPGLSSVKAYPNPGSDGHYTVTFASPSQQLISYTLLSSTGARLAGGRLSAEKFASSLHFNFSREMSSSGIYYLKLEGKEINEQIKLVRIK